MKIPQHEIIKLKTSDVKEDGKNPNRMSKAQMEALKKSIQKYGDIVPIVVNKDNLLADGAQRLQACKELGLETITAIKIDVKEVDRRVLRQVLNKLRGQHDLNLDIEEFTEILKEMDMNELQSLLPNENLDELLRDKNKLKEEDFDIEATVRNPKYKINKGDIYKLNNHLLICGDITIKEDITKLFKDTKANLIFTDPLYGVDYSSKNLFLNKIDKGSRVQTPIVNDNIKDYLKFFSDAFGNCKDFLTETNAVYITMAGKKLLELLQAMQNKEYKMSNLLVWVKNNHVLGRQDYSNKHEFIWYGWLNKHKFYAKFDTTVWHIDKPMESKLHPTMKPIELVARAIENSSKEGELVLDPFGGSGTTLIACEQLKRKCYMMEIDPIYCSVIIERWEALTNQKAVKL